MASAQSGAPVPAYCINLVDKYDAGCLPFPLDEKVANSAGSHPHEHLHKVRPTYAEKRNTRLPGNGPGQERLPGARGTYEQNPLGKSAAQLGEFLGVLEKLDYFL